MVALSLLLSLSLSAFILFTQLLDYIPGHGRAVLDSDELLTVN